jgi:hypothetical protein
MPYHHLNGRGCPKCGKSKKLTIEEFITISNIKHNNKYGYYEVIYVNSGTKVIIICPIHGRFEQKPNDHMAGHGCDCCGGKVLLTTNEFIAKANIVHDNTYEYLNSVYILSTLKIIITCKIHGDFLQAPAMHLSGQGCPKCRSEKTASIISSKGECEFLDHMLIPNRSKYIGCYIVDGYDPTTNTIYEYLGDYWHGNPVKFSPDKYNSIAKKTHGQLYDYTFIRFNIIKGMGYNIKYIWETDWIRFKNNIDKIPNVIDA